ncbi:hypothetical protein QMZ92_04220 [Streptomyces sp. HNM0645]|uniref:hypothetical protein n=1 Tax=Streptomyces sp. HNM0645 TaxID=2782343 RepID=UPI0024B876BA|nr:hypothetical protein [Streptomyces sp. HNM0645]MDI9883626.1 hypothetical protein [Streptomyces sp. HNM0645]
MNAITDTGAGRRLAAFFDNPVVGMLPWIMFSVLVGPGRFEFAVGVSLAIAVFVLVVDRLRRPGTSVKILEVSDVAFFAALTIVGLVASLGTLRWLETYSGELSNFALVAIAFGSIVVREPFTVQYARERVDRSLWTTRGFMHTNYVITAVWGLAFLVAAVAGLIGDLVLRQPDNIWTNWVVQIGAIIVALRFTEWYPPVVRERIHGGKPSRGGPTSVGSLFMPFAGYLVPVGIVVLALGSGPAWLGIALIVLGVLLVRAFKLDANGGRASEPRRDTE